MEKDKDPYDIDIQSCSVTDCTGLIPALPQTDAELEAYEDIYPFMAKMNTGEEHKG